jgi:hypothetical protein
MIPCIYFETYFNLQIWLLLSNKLWILYNTKSWQYYLKLKLTHFFSIIHNNCCVCRYYTTNTPRKYNYKISNAATINILTFSFFVICWTQSHTPLDTTLFWPNVNAAMFWRSTWKSWWCHWKRKISLEIVCES